MIRSPSHLFAVAQPRRFAAKLLAFAAVVCVAAAPAPARAESAEAAPATTAVDVQVQDAAVPHRVATIEYNPLSLFIDRFSLDVVVVPGDHHALIVSPFYTWAGTAEYSTGLDAQGRPLTNASGPYVLSVPRQTFKGFGGELGYRYYAGRGGPRGLFAGPSFLLDAITATAYSGSQTSFLGYGLAVDVGYEALIADTIAVSVGAGAQYMFTSKSIPPQQLPASIYANERLYPRLLLSFGYAL
jgi:hypothetical protein